MPLKTRRLIGLALLLGGIAAFYWAFGLLLLQCFDWVRHGRWFDLPLSTLLLDNSTARSMALGFVPSLPGDLLPQLRGAISDAGWLLAQPLGLVLAALGGLLVVLGGWIYE